MNNHTTNTYLPDYVVTPGEILEEYLDSFRMTQRELAQRSGLTAKTINGIIKGKSSIVPETALKFEKILGRPAHFWNNLETQYQESVLRLKEKETLLAEQIWADKFPYTEMVSRGWVAPAQSIAEQVGNLLNFFGVASPDIWKFWWEKQENLAFRQSGCTGSFEAATAWLRRGELEAQRIDSPEYNEKKFREALKKARKLTRLTSKDFSDRLCAYFNAAGVVLVLVPELSEAGIYGATRWINGRPIMQICLYSKSNDNFWFTIFHEAAHILKHGRKEFFIEGNSFSSEKEDEANIWARNFLIPEVQFEKLVKNGVPSLANIKIFAQKIDIHAGIVVGRLQHDGILLKGVGDKFKEFFEWHTKK